MNVAVVGAGDVGVHLTKVFSDRRINVVLSDRSRVAIGRAEDAVDAMTCVGNALHNSALKQLNCETLDLYVSVTSSDATNIVAAGRAKQLGARTAIARVDDPGFYRDGSHVVTNLFDVNVIVCASRVVGLEIIRKILSRDCVAVYEFGGFSLGIAEYRVPHASKLIDQFASELKGQGHVSFRGIVRNGLFRDIASIQKIFAGDEIVISGGFPDLLLTIRQLSGRAEDCKAVIVGGGDVGFQIAHALQNFEHKTYVIESDTARCEHLAAVLTNAVVLRGDGTNIDILRELKINAQDYIVSVAGSDDTNLMAALVGKNLGVGRCYTRLNRPGYQGIYRHLNIDETALHELMLKFIVNYVDARTLRSETTRHSHSYFEIRIPALEPSFNIGSFDLPSTVTLLGICHDFEPQFISQETAVHAGDSLVFSGPQTAIRSTANALMQLLKRTGE
jgi:trk system potassium uptake protein